MMKFNPLALMGNNPVVKLINGLRNGGDPNEIINDIITNHPKRDQIMKLVGGKSSDQLMETAENMCKERGTTIDEVLKQYGISR